MMTPAASVAVIGGGKIGLPIAACLAGNGAKVTVCDINRRLVDKVNAGETPHDEPGLAARLTDLVADGRLTATTDTITAVAAADVVIVVVAAMLTDERRIDYRHLLAACETVGRGLRRGTLVVIETTVPVGACRNILAAALGTGGLAAGQDFRFAFSPERVKSRHIFEHLTTTPKVVGGWDAASLAAAVRFYEDWLRAPVISVGSLEAAEFAKLAGMIYRDANIALANELSAFAAAAGLDVWSAIAAANTDGETHLLQPGIGVGGHCTPVYPYFLFEGAERLKTDPALARAARHVNEAQPARQVARLAQALGGLRGAHVHVMGLSFRPSVREDACSPAGPLRDALAAAGASVTLDDPLYGPQELAERGFAAGAPGAPGQIAVVLNTAHPEYATPDFTRWKTNGLKAVLDGRHLWKRAEVEAAGLTYLEVG